MIELLKLMKKYFLRNVYVLQINNRDITFPVIVSYIPSVTFMKYVANFNNSAETTRTSRTIIYDPARYCGEIGLLALSASVSTLYSVWGDTPARSACRARLGLRPRYLALVTGRIRESGLRSITF